MHDPRLNSVHLEPPRRDVFRQARERLLRARGTSTLAVENPAALADLVGGDGQTFDAALRHAVPSACRFVLMDHESVYPLKIGVNTIGRSPENDVIVKDAYVSRRHCAILVHTGDGCELHDIASKNGTFINGHRLSGPTRLQTGDEIRMCDRQFVLVSNTDEGVPDSHARTYTE